MTAPPDEFFRLANSLAIEFDRGDIDRFGRLLDLLLDANTRFNLTAITDPAQAWIRHIFDSLTLLPLIVSAESKTVIDVGSGGGLPGMPLAIVLPGTQFTLLEATRKKAAFLGETARVLGLGNVDVVSERAETAGRDSESHRERYDAAVSRAVGKMATLLELASPFAKIGGLILAIKGDMALLDVEQAKQALHRLHCRFEGLHHTPTGKIVIVSKQRPTPKAYPRRPGEPKRDPLH